jgi:8-oxo-dGTP pyrophosphatase MutT (NUDIX family)
MKLDLSLPDRIARRLARSLPGPAAQARFEPELNYGRHQIPPLPDSRRAAVMILLYPLQGQWCVPLIVRPENMSAHAGQVSFPGGEMDVGETVEQTALREFEEELGTGPDGFVLLGRLSPIYVHASNYRVTPCVAAATFRPAFRPNAAEVAKVLEPPVAELLSRRNRGIHWIRRRGISFRAPHIEVQGRRIWGATGMMLAEFMAVLNEARCS